MFHLTLIVGKKKFSNMKIGIIDYGAGNILSVYNAIYNLGYNPIIVTESSKIKNFDKLIIPGVGSAFHALNILKEKNFIKELKDLIGSKISILGICIGFQIFSKKLTEDGISKGINLFNADIIPISEPNIFNIGWCKVKLNKEIAAKIKINDTSDFYFCHSYYMKNNSINENNNCFGFAKFKKEIPSLVIKENFMGVQFHPEKSQANGIKFLKFFLGWTP